MKIARQHCKLSQHVNTVNTVNTALRTLTDTGREPVGGGVLPAHGVTACSEGAPLLDGGALRAP